MIALLRSLLLAPASLGLLAVLALAADRRAAASERNSTAIDPVVSGQAPVASISAFSDLRPGDWAYEALSQLIERHGCLSADTNRSFNGGRPMTRSEAAAWLNACLGRVSAIADAHQRLIAEFAPELAVLKGRVDNLEARVGALEASRFSPTTRLSGLATVVLGANSFGGSASDRVRQARQDSGGTTLNVDLQLTFDTSFTGSDLLRTNLRAGNFGPTSFLGAGPSSLSTLETAFQEDCGAASDCGDVVAIDRLFYQVPIGDVTVTVGGRVGQDDMLAIWPSVYPAETVLDVLTVAGAPAAYNKALGAGAGLWWQKNGFAVSANYVAANGDGSDPSAGGIATRGAGGTGSVQLGYASKQWAVAAVYAAIQNANDLIVYGTNFALDSFSHPGHTDAFGLSGYWQPAAAGWLPSISAGWGINSTRYSGDVETRGLTGTSQSWSVGLQWQDAFRAGNALGMAVGEPPFATRLKGGEPAEDGNLVWEWWYKLQVSDHIAVTPALFLLSRPLGADTPAGQSFHQLGGLIKTSFSF